MEKIKSFIIEHKAKLIVAGLCAAAVLAAFMGGFIQGCKCAS